MQCAGMIGKCFLRSRVRSCPQDQILKWSRAYDSVDKINNNVYKFSMNSKEFKRWLILQGATFGTKKGSHLKVYLNGRQSILPMHTTDLKKGTVEGIKKQLGLK
jgi:mRNA interferase HicA